MDACFILASKLGASEILLGMVVAVSTFTGLMLKPVFGFLSDRHGRWIWLVLGTAIFAATPILYLGVDSTESLVALRLFHGLATAIYGPVTLAFVAGLNTSPRAELFGWFGLSRTAGYVLGPLIGGALLMWVSPALVLAATSAIAVIAFAPVLYLERFADTGQGRSSRRNTPSALQLVQIILRNRPLLSFGIVELVSRIGVYAVKAFIPLVILGNGGTVFQAGLFLSVQEATVAMTRPLAGRIADRYDMAVGVATIGQLAIAFAPVLLSFATVAERLIFLAVLIGIGNGAYHPAALALIAKSTNPAARGFSFGVVGAFRNAGKLLGPILGGVLLYTYPPEVAFALLGLLTCFAAVPLCGTRVFRGRVRGQV